MYSRVVKDREKYVYSAICVLLKMLTCPILVIGPHTITFSLVSEQYSLTIHQQFNQTQNLLKDFLRKFQKGLS